ncbi:MAG: beta-ketoacyl-ACP synthase II [Myxococcota bacterium]|nr:beta-ketoacyl-ACP synthase II [Myxococcota bacterium]
MRRVVVTGLGAISPCGMTAESSWNAVLSSNSAVAPISGFSVENWPVQYAAEIKNYDPSAHFDRSELKRLDRFTQYALIAAKEAIHDSGLSIPLGDRGAVYIGSGIGGVGEISDATLRLQKRGPRGVGVMFIVQVLPNLAGGQVALYAQAKGPSLCISTACAAGNHSIGEAYKSIVMDEADVAIAGACEAGITPIGMSGFMNMRAMSKRNTKDASRPFDRTRDGFVMGEGAGILILEELDHALRRGARIYAEIVGYAQNNDAHHVTAPPDRHQGAYRCMKAALRSAGITPDQIDYINAHGTSTPQNDLKEIQAICDVFQEHSKALFISSTKGVTGHLLGASGGLEGVFLAKAISSNTIPPNAHLEDLDPLIEGGIFPREMLKKNIRYGLSNAFGFGGCNASIIMKKWEAMCES